MKLRDAFAPANRPCSYDSGLRGVDMAQIDSLERGRTRVVLYLAQEAPVKPFLAAVRGNHRTSEARLVQVNKRRAAPRLNGSFVKRLTVLRQHYALHSLIDDLGKAGLITPQQQRRLLPDYFKAPGVI